MALACPGQVHTAQVEVHIAQVKARTAQVKVPADSTEVVEARTGIYLVDTAAVHEASYRSRHHRDGGGDAPCWLDVERTTKVSGDLSRAVRSVGNVERTMDGAFWSIMVRGMGRSRDHDDDDVTRMPHLFQRSRSAIGPQRQTLTIIVLRNALFHFAT